MLCVVVAWPSACTQRERGAPPEPDAAPALVPSSSASSATAAPAPADAKPRPAPAPVASVPAVPASDWVWKVYLGDHFTVLFPGEPKVHVLPAEEDKAGYSEALFDVPGGQVSLAAGYTEHAQEDVSRPEGFLDDRTNAPRRGFTEVLHKRSVSLPGGHPGRVLIQRRNISGTPLRVYSRLYLVGRRLYSLIVSTLDVGGISEDVVKKFMDSFRLV
jgi:hypothetical protein